MPLTLKQSPNMLKRLKYGALLLCIPGMTYGISAHAGWFDQGKELLGDILGQPQTQTLLSDSDISAGLKEALRVGTDNVVTQLGRSGGFNNDPSIHIPLPQNLKTVKTTLDQFGMGSMMGDLELKLNEAAEAATPRAKQLFINAIAQMTLSDVQALFKGPDDAATRYFQNKMSPQLAAEMQPIVNNSLAEVGAVRSYDKAMGKYTSLPFVPDIKADLTNHVVQKGMEGVFHYLAIEEAKIRQDPARRTTDLLKRVFGQN